MDPLQWMGAVRMTVQTADKNITIIHTTPVHQVKFCEKQIHHYDVLTLNPRFWPKYESIIHDIAFFRVKVRPLLSSHIKINGENSFGLFFVCKLYLICADFSPNSDETIVFTGGSDIMDRGLIF